MAGESTRNPERLATLEARSQEHFRILERLESEVKQVRTFQVYTIAAVLLSAVVARIFP